LGSFFPNFQARQRDLRCKPFLNKVLQLWLRKQFLKVFLHTQAPSMPRPNPGA